MTFPVQKFEVEIGLQGEAEKVYTTLKAKEQKASDEYDLAFQTYLESESRMKAPLPPPRLTYNLPGYTDSSKPSYRKLREIERIPKEVTTSAYLTDEELAAFRNKKVHYTHLDITHPKDSHDDFRINGKKAPFSWCHSISGQHHGNHMLLLVRRNNRWDERYDDAKTYTYLCKADDFWVLESWDTIYVKHFEENLLVFATKYSSGWIKPFFIRTKNEYLEGVSRNEIKCAGVTESGAYIMRDEYDIVSVYC
jgi:hypothetical protein